MMDEPSGVQITLNEFLMSLFVIKYTFIAPDLFIPLKTTQFSTFKVSQFVRFRGKTPISLFQQGLVLYQLEPDW